MTDDSVQLAVPPSPRNARLVLRVAGWNLLFTLVGLLLIGIAGEAYFRLNGRFERVGSTGEPSPFERVSSISADEPSRFEHVSSIGADGPSPFRFVPGAGLLRPPHTDLVFHPTSLNLRTVQSSNSLGFLDREPIDPARAAESCHISIIGDSFVEGREVNLSDKLQVRLEELAAREAPHLDVTTSAFGIQATGQVNQLPYYDGYARHLSPDLVVLVFYGENDLIDNSAVLSGLMSGNNPEHPPRTSAVRDVEGKFFLSIADADFREHLIHQPSKTVRLSWITSVLEQFSDVSSLARWLRDKNQQLRYPHDNRSVVMARAQYFMEQAMYMYLFKGREPVEFADGIHEEIFSGVKTTITQEAWDATRFALEQFKRRADHDGAALMVLTVHDFGGSGGPMFDRLSNMAGSLDIPVISQHDYIIRQGDSVENARFYEDFHWNPLGHQWSAEAIWERIKTEWNGECPYAVPRSEIEVGWIRVGRYFHTPDGEMFVESYPALNPEGYKSVYSSVVSSLPVARSDWNVYSYSKGLTYTMEPCVEGDTEKRFYLHVFPEDYSVLTTDRWQSGFENISFDFHVRGEYFNGKCIVSVDLPEYEIDYIRTGQFAKVTDSEDVHIWGIRYNFALPKIADAVQKFLLSGREPEIRSDFDVYIEDAHLIYVKDSCDADDRDTPFFLHVVPADANDLSVGREDSGFDNLGFELMQKGGVHDGGCFATVDLPEYEISSIRTGQVADSTETWRARYNFALPGIIDAVNESRRSEREPDIQSNFDVYINGGRLIYVKESCTADDHALPFFLHVFPADENDLVAGREVSGFDNLDFELMQKGGVHDDGCFASVDLPEYDIASIRTGQWVRGEAHVWEANIDFAK